uniref:uncharacterized protein n=1 Tax=Semicossyphus pulcher TaxID=241346 RepID=UPI0037E999B6
MRSRNLFLLVYLLWLGTSSADGKKTCTSKETCDQDSKEPDSTSHFLQCVGLPSTDTGKDHLRRLKGMLEATMDVYTFMRSSMSGVPLLSLQGALELNPEVDPFQNEDLVHMWMEVKIKPLLKSITKHFLSCLSTRNFSCSTYQTVVRELSHHYSEMNPVRQKWIYTFFMYPFLSGDRVAGCVKKDEGSEEWLMRNFGAFRAMARMKDFSALNMVFSGLEVLHLLSPAQKADLLLQPGVNDLDNSTLSLVFHSLMTGGPGPGPHPSTSPGWGHNWTTPGNPPPKPTFDPFQPPSPHDRLGGVVKGVMGAFRPIGSFVHDFVSFTHERDLSQMRSTTLTQFLLNWTLSELADMYRPKETPVVPEGPKFDLTNVEDWYKQVVMPLLRRFLPKEEYMEHHAIKMAFHEVFYLDHCKNNETSEVPDVCSITLDKSPCGLTDAVENVAHVMHCAARTNLVMSEKTVKRLIMEMLKRLNSLIKELSKANFHKLAYDIKEIFSESESPAMTREHLEDPDFIKLWFQIKLMPLLPDVPTGLLSCLSTKNFSCPVYQTIVAQLSDHMSFMSADRMYSHNIYDDFIFPFLLHHNTSDPQCVSSANNNSAEWLMENFGSFSIFASVTDFYELNPTFSGLEVLPLLTPKQTAEMLLLPLPTPPEKEFVIDRVFDFLLGSPQKIPEVLHYLVLLAREVNPSCSVYERIFERLYDSIPSVPPAVEPAVWGTIDDLISFAPEECVPANITCPMLQINDSRICRGVDSSQLLYHLNTSMEVSCNFTLETYACAQLEKFTAHQLVSLLKCNLPGNSSHSTVLWKMLLTKLSPVLEPALDMLANMSVVIPSARQVLDVIGEIRVSLLTDEELMNSSVIMKWFPGRLSSLLPSASGRFLHCLSSRNISCHSYQQILRVFIHRFENMTSTQQHVVLHDFILRFLSHSGPSCVSISNSSAEWLMRNLGPFSAFLLVRDLIHLNPLFNPLEVLPLLTPKHNAELLALTLSTLPEEGVLINVLFDHLADSPDTERFKDFLFYIVFFLQQGNLSCSSYRTLFTRLDLALSTAPLDVESSIAYTKVALSKHIPPGCIIYSGQCNVTVTNETDICVGVNSTMLELLLHSGQIKGRVCDFTPEEFACARLRALKAEDLTMLLACNRSSNSSGSRPAWKLLLSKASHVLDEALDHLSNMTLDPRNPAVSMILDSIREIRLDTLSLAALNNPAVIQLWFNRRLRPFLPAVSPDILSCLTTKGFNCSTFQHVVQILSSFVPHMTPARQRSIYTHFIEVFLSMNDTADPGCRSGINSSTEWVQRNLGAFAGLVSIQDIQRLYPDFIALEALSQLEVGQLAEIASTPGQLTSPAEVELVMSHVPDHLFSAFFDDFSPAIMGRENMIPSEVRSAILQVVFDRANLSDHSVSDSVVFVWLHIRLRPLLVNLSHLHVAPFFRILAGRNCNIQQLGVNNLNETISSLGDVTQNEVHNQIIQSLRGPVPLQCYGDNFNQSFYIFLEQSFLGFQFPNLTTFLSLIPQDRTPQVLNSLPPSDLGDFLRRPNVVDNDAELCVIYDNYIQTPNFLETERLPVVVRRPTLPCVWPTAISSTDRSEVNAWFERRLPEYTPFLTKTLISPDIVQNASCFAFQRIVTVVANFNFNAADFTGSDFSNTIRDYLTTSSAPRCYNPSDPELNSTAWFAECIGSFISFLTLEDIQSFGSAEVIQVFTVNPQNIALFNQPGLPTNLTNYYTELLYQQDSNFNPLLLPESFWCVVPGLAFSQLNAAQSMTVLHNVTSLCTDLDPQISAALAGNLGDNIDASAISALGSESTGLSTGQILMISPQDLLTSLSTLSLVIGWNRGQAQSIIRLLLSSGMMQINSSASLVSLGSLVTGIPASTFTNIKASELITASQSSSFLGHFISAPTIVRQTFVSQIIAINSNSETIIQNVPDELATEVPRVLLSGFSSTSTVVTRLNRKKWKRRQAELFFDVVAVESSTLILGTPDNLSSSVLQGFTCTSVRSVKRRQIRKLVRACRRRGRDRVNLVETQLTCMYNHINADADADATTFSLYPPDMLLYYDYSLVPQNMCRSYFTELAAADFTLFSSALSYKLDALFVNARSCLGFSQTTD